jgi:hypothetical protein
MNDSVEDQNRNMREKEIQNEYIRLSNEQIKLKCIQSAFEIFRDNREELLKVLDKLTSVETVKKELVVENVINEPDEPIEAHDTEQSSSVSQPQPPSTLPPPKPLSNAPQHSANELAAIQPNKRKPAVGPIVQIYDPANTTQVFKVFDGLFQATIEIPSASLTAIKEAVKNKTIYKGYRWHMVPRDDPEPNAPKHIGATKDSQIKVRGALIAMMNVDTGLVEKLFTNQTEAAAHISKCPASICLALKSGSATGGYNWKYWNLLSENLQHIYLTNNALPEPVHNTRATMIQRIDSKTGEVLEEFNAMVDIYKKHGITPKCIKKAHETSTPYKGFAWRICN